MAEVVKYIIFKLKESTLMLNFLKTENWEKYSAVLYP